MIRIAWRAAAVAAWLLGGTPGGALAQDGDEVELQGEDEMRDAEARRLFEAGRLAFVDGRYEDALRYFRDAHELSGRPELLFNIGTTADRLQRNEEALTAFQRYLEHVSDAPNRREVQGRIRLLRRALEQERERRAQQAQAAPSPDETAAAGASGQAPFRPLEAPPGSETDEGSLAGRWWLWTIVGAVVVGAAVTAAVLLTREPRVEEPELGSTGQVFSLLKARP